MRVLFAGTGTVIPEKNRFPTSVYVISSGTGLLLDIGPGILSRLSQFEVHTSNLDAVFVSHFHLDHIADLPTLLFISKIKRFGPPLILGPKGLKEWIERAKKLYGSQIVGDFVLTVKEVNPGERLSIKDLNLTFFKTYHTEESIGVVVESQRRSLIYTSDAGLDNSLFKVLPTNPDMLVTECSLPYHVEGHMTPETLGKLAQTINPKVLAVIHLYPINNREETCILLKRFWNGEIIFPEDGTSMVI